MPRAHLAGDDGVSATRPLVLLVDDDEGVRRSLALLVRAAGYEVLVWGSATEFLRQTLPDRPACLVLDLRLPDLDGLDLLEALRERESPPPVIFLTGHGDIRTSVRAMRTGAFDFLEKPVEADALLGVIGRAVAHDRAARERLGIERAARARFDTLTAREVEVCRLVATGMPNKAIASQLGISIKTVKVHRGRVFQKLGVASLADLVRLAAALPAPDRSPTPVCSATSPSPRSASLTTKWKR